LIDEPIRCPLLGPEVVAAAEFHYFVAHDYLAHSWKISSLE
jgi:hypothetical protein